MSQKAKNWSAIFAALALAAVVVFGMFIYAGVRNIEMPVVPTADEIASKIVIPPIVIPDTNNQQQQEIWDEVYKEKVDALERLALEACINEYDFEGIEDLFIFLLVALFGLCFMIISVIVKSSSDNLLQRVEIYYKTKDYLSEYSNKKK